MTKFINPMLDVEDAGELEVTEEKVEKSLPKKKFINPILDEVKTPDPSDPNLMGSTLSPAEALGSIFTGEGRTEFPEAREFGAIMPETKGELVSSLGQLVSAEPEQFADIVKQQIPEAKTFKDKFGNVMIKYKGEDYYANKPGLSGTDFTKFVADIAEFLPAGKLAGLFKGLATRTLAMGAGSAGTSVAQDLAAEQLGSKQGVSGERALLTGLFGSAGELVGPFVSNLYRRTKSVPQVVTPEGELTPIGLQILEHAKIDPRSITKEIGPQFQAAITDLIRKGQEGLDVTTPIRAAVSRGRTSQFGIPKTKGQVTRDPEQLGFEDAAASGAYGPEAQKMILETRGQQRGAVEGAVERLKSEVGPGTVSTPEEAAEILLGATQKQASKARKEIGKAYADVEQPMMRTQLTQDSVNDLADRVDATVSFDMFLTNEKLAPATNDLLKHLDKLRKAETDSVRMFELEQTRKYMNRLGEAAEKADKRQVVQIKKMFDGWLDDEVELLLRRGDIDDPKVLEQIKEARKLRAKYGEKFEERKGKFGDDAGKIIQKMAEYEDVTPLEVANWIYGTAKLGEVPRSSRVISRLKKIFPEDSPEWGTLREGALLRVFKGSGTKLPGPQQMINKLDGILEGKGLGVTKKLFTEDQIKLLRSFREDLKDLVPPEGTTNAPKTAYKLAEIGRQYLTRILPGMQLATGDVAGYVALKGMEKMSERGAKKGVKEAVKGYTVPTKPVSRLVPSSGAATGSQVETTKNSPSFEKLRSQFKGLNPL